MGASCTTVVIPKVLFINGFTGMLLIVNHQSKIYKPAPQNLEELLAIELKPHSKGIAVAVNGQVIQKANWANCPLQESDSILIITATQGG
ncbi:sulfur carrier protein ThiS [Sphingobacterium lactis]|uniref:Sulfur carrier protein n=2 Tax=Sphingobacterium lactis TaxID=797291 RepID=A0A1H5XZK0_9SPHI|nr:sulfur carrier protein ThiS [Sphingobacterium lactis]SEG16706.1 sulfur carrier protein [Sphingobacterium lactis]